MVPKARVSKFTTIKPYYTACLWYVKYLNFIFSRFAENLAGPSFKGVIYGVFLLKSRFGCVDKFQVRLGLRFPNYRTFDGAADDVTRLRDKF